MTLNGTWQLDGSILTTTITNSSDPDFVANGEVSKDEILELTATTLRYRDEDGLVVRETHAGAVADAPAKVPGKPVPPGEVKAISAAIAEMERCFRETNYDGIVKGTYPGLISEMGDGEEFRKTLEGAVATMQPGKVKIGTAELEVPAELHEAGEEWVCFVPKRNKVQVESQPILSVGFFVAIRKKAEKDWKLLDGAGLRRNPEMLWTLLPELPKVVKIPENKTGTLGEQSLGLGKPSGLGAIENRAGSSLSAGSRGITADATSSR